MLQKFAHHISNKGSRENENEWPKSTFRHWNGKEENTSQMSVPSARPKQIIPALSELLSLIGKGGLVHTTGCRSRKCSDSSVFCVAS